VALDSWVITWCLLVGRGCPLVGWQAEDDEIDDASLRPCGASRHSSRAEPTSVPDRSATPT